MENNENELNNQTENLPNDDELIKLIVKLEEFVLSPEFSNTLNEFMSKNSKNFVVNEKGEHAIQNYSIYKQYVKLIETCLESKF